MTRFWPEQEETGQEDWLLSPVEEALGKYLRNRGQCTEAWWQKEPDQGKRLMGRLRVRVHGA